MIISCTQFEELISFYIDGDLSESLKTSFEEHLNSCSDCNMRYQVIKKIITDVKEAYSKFIEKENNCIEADYVVYKPDDSDYNQELSAYIDNELPENYNFKIRRNMIVKPKIRTELEKMYRLRKIMSDSYIEQKNKLKTDFSKNVLKLIDKSKTEKEIYVHCSVFILIVLSAIALSVWVILKVI